MQRFVSLSSIVAVAVGCGSTPTSGVWDYTDEDVVTNTCTDALDYDGTSGEFTIENHGDGTFTVDPQDGSDSFECTLDGKGYSCPSRIAEVVDLGLGAEAEVTVSVEGEFDGSKEATGTQTATFTCLDQSCETIAALAGIPSPCTIEVEFEASWVDAL